MYKPSGLKLGAVGKLLFVAAIFLTIIKLPFKIFVRFLNKRKEKKHGI